MSHFWEIIASNALVTSVLAVGVTILSRMWKNPPAIHLVWMVVLLKFFTPPVLTARLPIAADWLPSGYSTNSADRSASALAVEQDTLANPRSTKQRNSNVNDEHYVGKSTLNVVAAHEQWPLLTILMDIWILGSLCVALGYAILILRFSTLLRNIESPPQDISTMVTQLANRLGLSRPPEVLMTPRALPPLVWFMGRRPRLILPSELFARLSEDAQATILAHELVHISRRDYLVRVLELFATTLFWWHPVVWWACSQLRELEEECCDSRAMELVPQQARTYASALVDTLEFLSQQRRVFVPFPTAVCSTPSLSRRIQMLSQARTNRLSVQNMVIVGIIAALPLAIVFTAEASDATNDAATHVLRPAAAAPAPIPNGRAKNDAGQSLVATRTRVGIPGAEVITASASRISYDAATGQLTFAGSAGSPAELTQNVDSQRRQSLRAQKIIYSLKDGGLHAKELVFVGSANSQAKLPEKVESRHNPSIRAKKITFSLDDGTMGAEEIELLEQNPK